MQFNPDPNKQANEVIFSQKTCSNNLSHPPISFNNNGISKCSHQKHLGIVLDSKLNFNAHVDQKIKKFNRILGLIRQLSINLMQNALLTIYKSFGRPHLDYGDILHDKRNNENFQNKLEKVQYNRACLAITGAIQGTSRTKLYDELGLHSLIKRCWCNKLIFFLQTSKWSILDYPYSCLDFPSQINYFLRSIQLLLLNPLCQEQNPSNPFSPYYINEWNNLTVEIRNPKSVSAFKKLDTKKRKLTILNL